jgi:hypothetical protein
LKGRDLVVHFFLPPDLRPADGEELPINFRSYWLERFPKALDEVARSYFQADSPRLQAKYTAELNSWWFLAQGYDHLVGLHTFVLGFLEKLDSSLGHIDG